MRMFLHIREGDRLIEDPDGEEFVSLDAVRTEAVGAARDILAADLRIGRWNPSRSFEVRDASGAMRLTLPFTDAIPV